MKHWTEEELIELDTVFLHRMLKTRLNIRGDRHVSVVRNPEFEFEWTRDADGNYARRGKVDGVPEWVPHPKQPTISPKAKKAYSGQIPLIRKVLEERKLLNLILGEDK